MHRLLPFLPALMVLSCSQPKSTKGDGIADGVYTPNDVTLIAPSNPIGTLSGQILDSNGAPLAGASVVASLPAGEQTATTDSQGVFEFKSLPGGTTVGMTITKTGYTSATTVATVPASAGNVPLDNGNAFVGPIELFATTGKLVLSVVGYDGQAVSTTGVAQIAPSYLIDSAGANTPSGTLVVQGMGATGSLTFANVPTLSALAKLGASAATLAFALDPVVDANGNYQYGGATLFLTAEQALASPALLSVVLPPPAQAAGSLSIVGSNIGSLVNPPPGAPADSLVQSTSKVYVAFNQRVIQQSIAVTVTDDTGAPFPVNIEAGTAGNLFDFIPTDGSWIAGEGYTVTVNAIAEGSEPEVEKAFSGFIFADVSGGSGPALTHAFFTPDPVTGKLDNGATVQLGFDSQLGNSGGAVLSAYIDADLDGDGKRLSVGEFDPTGHNTSAGFPVSAQGATLEGFSRTYAFTVRSNAQGVNSNTPVYVYFDDSRTPTATPVQWLNGTVLGANNTVNTSLAPTP